MIMSFKPVIKSLLENCQTLARAIEFKEKDLAEWERAVEHKKKTLAELRADYWVAATEILIKIEERREKALHSHSTPEEPLDSVEKDAVKV